MNPHQRNKKLSARNLVGKLGAPQQAAIEKWLFEDNWSYPAVVRAMKEQFNVNVTPKSLFNFYRHLNQRRITDSILAHARSADDTARACAEGAARTCPDQPEVIYQEILKAVGQIAFRKAMDDPDSPDHATIRDYTKLLSSARRENIQNGKLSLDREKWEFDVARICVEHLAELQAITANSTMNEHQRLQAIRHRLFGKNLPD